MVILGRGFVRSILKLDPDEDSDVVFLPSFIPRFEEVLLPRISLFVARLSSQETCCKPKSYYDVDWWGYLICTC